MTCDHQPVYQPASPEYVLAVIRDWHRQQCRFDPEAEPGVDLTFETTIAEWRDACDLLGWEQLGRGLNAEWNLTHPDATWRSVLEPARFRTLRDLCQFIAEEAGQPCIHPARFFGTTCATAGAFLTIRTLLRDAGANMSGLSPSARLDEYARRHTAVFLGPISRLAPNALPPVEIYTPLYDRCCGLVCLGLAVGTIGWFLSPFASVVGYVLAAAAYGAVWIVADLPPSRVKFGSLRTFRELSRIVAEGARLSD
jgi:hypothetical protein